MEEQLTQKQKLMVVSAQRHIMLAAQLLDDLDTEIQSEGSTGPNPINHTQFDLENTANYIGHWSQHGIEL